MDRKPFAIRRVLSLLLRRKKIFWQVRFGRKRTMRELAAVSPVAAG